ncbi:MAG: cation-transporting P-type ATPase [Acidobacteriota bacterium]
MICHSPVSLFGQSSEFYRVFLYNEHMAGAGKKTEFWKLEVKDVFEVLESSLLGLTEAEANKRFRLSGPNEIAGKEKRPGIRILLGQFTNSFVLVLVGAAGIAWFLRDRTDALVIRGLSLRLPLALEFVFLRRAI